MSTITKKRPVKPGQEPKAKRKVVASRPSQGSQVVVDPDDEIVVVNLPATCDAAASVYLKQGNGWWYGKYNYRLGDDVHGGRTYGTRCTTRAIALKGTLHALADKLLDNHRDRPEAQAIVGACELLASKILLLASKIFESQPPPESELVDTTVPTSVLSVGSVAKPSPSPKPKGATVSKAKGRRQKAESSGRIDQVLAPAAKKKPAKKTAAVKKERVCAVFEIDEREYPADELVQTFTVTPAAKVPARALVGKIVEFPGGTYERVRSVAIA